MWLYSSRMWGVQSGHWKGDICAGNGCSIRESFWKGKLTGQVYFLLITIIIINSQLVLCFCWSYDVVLTIIMPTWTENPACICWTKAWRCRDRLRSNCQSWEGTEMEVSIRIYIYIYSISHHFICTVMKWNIKIIMYSLHTRAKYGVEEMCRDLWNWASKNPYGYGSPDSSNWSSWI